MKEKTPLLHKFVCFQMPAWSLPQIQTLWWDIYYKINNEPVCNFYAQENSSYPFNNRINFLWIIIYSLHNIYIGKVMDTLLVIVKD